MENSRISRLIKDKGISMGIIKKIILKCIRCHQSYVHFSRRIQKNKIYCEDCLYALDRERAERKRHEKSSHR